MNHGDTDDTEIISGDEDDLPPIDDITAEANEVSGVEQIGEPIAEYHQPPEVIDQPATIVSQSETDEPQPPAEANVDWQSVAMEESVAPVETVSETSAPEKVQSQPSGWQRARNFFFGGSAIVAARINNLTQAIEDAPESPVNYVLRAEIYMDLREYALAQADFQRAVELAETQFELADWGLLDQVMRDRALTGLDKVRRRLR